MKVWNDAESPWYFPLSLAGFNKHEADAHFAFSGCTLQKKTRQGKGNFFRKQGNMVNCVV